MSRNVQSHDASGQTIGVTEWWQAIRSTRKPELKHRSEECLLVRPLTASKCFICTVCLELRERFKRDTQDLTEDEEKRSMHHLKYEEL